MGSLLPPPPPEDSPICLHRLNNPNSGESLKKSIEGRHEASELQPCLKSKPLEQTCSFKFSAGRIPQTGDPLLLSLFKREYGNCIQKPWACNGVPGADWSGCRAYVVAHLPLNCKVQLPLGPANA